MAKTTKKQEHEFLGIFIKVKCPVTNKEVMIEVSYHDFQSSEQECELCGSHGSLSVDFKCPECNQYHNHTLKSW